MSGNNKAFIKLNSKMVIEMVISNLSRIVSEIIISANISEDYEQFGFPVVSDEIPQQGPLGGILAGLKASSSDANIVVACDMPFLNIPLLKFLTTQIKGNDIVIPVIDGKMEPLHAVYSKNCIEPIENQFKENNFKVISFFENVKVDYVEEDVIKMFDPEKLSFFNLNTAEDVKRAREIYGWGEHYAK
ncbi:MAG: molybdenum cofactor guanylyltransferase [Actinobacteria bacterium]|nr:molybdenum cofactor guanylyltransferase [Actinomycetota bacterium]